MADTLVRAKVWQTGHIVIPKKLREKAGILPGDEVVISCDKDKVIIMKNAV